MPLPRYLFLLAAVLAAAGLTVLLGTALAPRLADDLRPWALPVTLAAAAALAIIWRRR